MMATKQAKKMAETLKEFLDKCLIFNTKSSCLDAVAVMHGFRHWADMEERTKEFDEMLSTWEKMLKKEKVQGISPIDIMMLLGEKK